MQTLLQISNSTGYVSFQNTSAGSYTFKIVRSGYPQTNETLDYSGQPLILTIPLTVNIDSNTHTNNLTAIIVAVIITSAVTAIVVYVLLVKRRKPPNMKNLQQLKKQMESKKKY